jgi:hypothetical protein
MRLRPLISAPVLVAALVVTAACSSSTNTATSSTPPAPQATTANTPSNTPSASPAVADTTEPSVSGTTALKACDIVTASEASALAGTTYGTGTEETTGSGSSQGQRCTYGAGTKNVFFVQIAQADSAADAQAAWAVEQAKANAALSKGFPPSVPKPNFDTTNVAGVGDMAATVTWSDSISGITISISAIYALQGANFLAFGDTKVGGTAPSTSDLETQAKTSLARM